MSALRGYELDPTFQSAHARFKEAANDWKHDRVSTVAVRDAIAEMCDAAALWAQGLTVSPLRPLTRKQAMMLDFITAYIYQNNFAPSLEEIADHFRLRAISTVHEKLVELESKGWIRRTHGLARAIQLVGAA